MAAESLFVPPVLVVVESWNMIPPAVVESLVPAFAVVESVVIIPIVAESTKWIPPVALSVLGFGTFKLLFYNILV